MYSLITQFFKVNYFFTSGFLTYNLCHNPNYIYRNIWTEKPLLKANTHWSIGVDLLSQFGMKIGLATTHAFHAYMLLMIANQPMCGQPSYFFSNQWNEPFIISFFFLPLSHEEEEKKS